jgi:hypothetical protein
MCVFRYTFRGHFEFVFLFTIFHFFFVVADEVFVPWYNLKQRVHQCKNLRADIKVCINVTPDGGGTC